MQREILNNTQWDIVRAFSFAHSEETRMQIRMLLSDYLAQQAEDEMDALWDTGEWNDEKNEALLSEHLRTPYRTKAS